MRRAVTAQRSVCQICAFASGRIPHAAKQTFASPNVFLRLAQPSRIASGRPSYGGTRLASSLTQAYPRSTRKSLRNEPQQIEETTQDSQSSLSSRGESNAARELPDLQKLAAIVEQNKQRFLCTDGIPSAKLTLAALQTCLGAAKAVQPHIARSEARSGTTPAPNLLSLDSSKAKTGSASISQTSSAQLNESVAKIVDAAYAVVAHPTVSITPEVLELYVDILAKLAKAETLTHVFDLYASKPKPRNVSGTIEFVQQNPSSAANAIEAKLAETALATAIDAKNLDAAIGIVEACYTTKAFIRQKLLRKGLLPASALAAAPFAAYLVASNLANLQNALDPSTATGIAFAGILAYLGFTASIGTVARITSSDENHRVTWAPGTPLRERWMREEERAAFGKIASAWGFKERWRHGEERGPEWEALREYLGLRGFILDRVEFLEGMN
jgi:hypothetical protein